MVANLKPGSVVVDLAAAAGGNVAGTVKDQVTTTEGGVTLIGYTDMNSRLASTSSSLYANNQLKWILSAGPTTTKVKGELALDHEDIAVRGMMVLEKGVMTWPWIPPAYATQASNPSLADPGQVCYSYMRALPWTDRRRPSLSHPPRRSCLSSTPTTRPCTWTAPRRPPTPPSACWAWA